MDKQLSDIFQQAQGIVSALSDDTLERLCSAKRQERKIAVKTILEGLAGHAEKDTLLQAFPVALVQSGESIGTIYFLQECLKNGAFFDPKVINGIISALAAERVECIHEDDTEALETITNMLHSFYNTLLNHPEYREKPEIYLTIGTSVEQEKDTWTAIELYNEAIGLGSMDGYYFAASAYEALGKYEMSATIFDTAYQLSGELRFLDRYIHALCKAGKREEAYTYYLYLEKQSKKTINPFIVYAGTIENDADLREFDLLMTAYHGESTFEPSESLRDLALQASVYISNEIERESATIEGLNHVPIESWTDEQDTIYRKSIRRRLHLMQIHIITIQDPRYLEFYLDETRRYTIEGNARTQHMMNEYFRDSFSPYVFASYQQISRDKNSRIEDMELFESMRIHLVQMSAIFSHHSFLETIRDQIDPFIDECMKIEGIADKDDLESPNENELILKKSRQEYDTLSESTKKLYENFVAFIDQKYGMFYRRSIQLLVRDEDAVPLILKKEYEEEMRNNGGDHVGARNTVISHMKVFLEYPDIALLFLLEKIMLGQDILSEDETMEGLVERHHFDSLIKLDALLLGGILYENGEYEHALEYMMNVAGLLDVPKVLFMIAEWIRYMDDEKTISDTVGVLDTICQQEYEAESFFDHISNVLQDIFESTEPSDEEVANMLMAHANMQVIRKGDPQEIVIEFQTAGEHGSPQGYISAGDIYAELGNHDKAIELFHKAYLLSPNIVSLRRLLNTLLIASRFDAAWEYIEMAIRDNFDIPGYISAWYLYQGKNKEAMEELCKIIQSSGMIDMILPEGYMELLAASIQEILNSPESSIEQEILRIHASYLNASISSGNEDSDPEDYVHHVAYIGGAMEEYGTEEVISILLKTIPFFTGEIDLDDDASDIDKALGYLHLHLTKVHNILSKCHRKNQKNRDPEGTRKTFDLINAINISAVVLFQRFPKSEKYLKEWRGAINMLPTAHDANHTIHKMPEMIQ